MPEIRLSIARRRYRDPSIRVGDTLRVPRLSQLTAFVDETADATALFWEPDVRFVVVPDEETGGD